MIELLAGLDPALVVFLVAAWPVVELRGAIPLGIALGLTPAQALLLGICGSLLPVPFLLVGLRPMVSLLGRTHTGRRAVEWLRGRTHGSRSWTARTGLVGLILLVSVPLPSTGAWTGAIVASLLGFRIVPAMLAISAGTSVAGLLVLAIAIWGRLAYG